MFILSQTKTIRISNLVCGITIICQQLFFFAKGHVKECWLGLQQDYPSDILAYNTINRSYENENELPNQRGKAIAHSIFRTFLLNFVIANSLNFWNTRKWVYMGLLLYRFWGNLASLKSSVRFYINIVKFSRNFVSLQVHLLFVGESYFEASRAIALVQHISEKAHFLENDEKYNLLKHYNNLWSQIHKKYKLYNGCQVQINMILICMK